MPHGPGDLGEALSGLAVCSHTRVLCSGLSSICSCVDRAPSLGAFEAVSQEGPADPIPGGPSFRAMGRLSRWLWNHVYHQSFPWESCSKVPEAGDLSNRESLSPSSGGWRSKRKVFAGPCPFCRWLQLLWWLAILGPLALGPRSRLFLLSHGLCVGAVPLLPSPIGTQATLPEGHVLQRGLVVT